MKTFGQFVLGAIALFVVVVGLCGVSWMSTYNAHATNAQQTERLWSDVESDMKRRADLIPNLVATVKGYADHEKETFAAVTEARSKIGQINIGSALGDPEKMAALSAASSELSGALSKLMVVAEAYPDLKASQGFQDLQTQLEGTENRINVSRKRYNEDVVQVQNDLVVTAWGGLVASVHGFTKAEYFKANEEDLVNPEVSFE